MGAGVPEGLAVLGVFKGVQIFFGHNNSSLLIGRRYKNTHPLKIRGGIQSIPRFHPGYSAGLSLIGALTGAPGLPFPTNSSEVVSIPAEFAEPLHLMGSSLGILRGGMSSSKPLRRLYHKKRGLSTTCFVGFGVTKCINSLWKR
jgi:hypothetical protein